MARRKRKLNKRIIVLLIIAGVLLAGGVSAVIILNLEQDPTLKANKGEEAYKAGDYEKALRLYNSANKDKPSPQYDYKIAEILWTRVNDPNVRLSKTERMENVGGAIGRLRNALRTDPEYEQARRFLCEIYWQENRNYEDFTEKAEKLLESNPDDHQIHFRCGVVLSRLAYAMGGDYAQRAENHLRKATQLKPDEMRYWLNYAKFLQRIGKIDQAEEIYLQAVEKNPSDPTLHVNYAEFLLGQNRDDKALEHINQAIEGAPGQAEGHIALAKFYQSRGHLDYDKAVKALETAREIEPGEFAIYLNLGKIYEKQKLLEQAEAAYREGIEVVQKRLSSGEEINELQRRALGNGSVRLKYELANVLLSQLPDEGPQRDELISEARTYKEQIEKNNAESVYADQIGGRIAFIQGDYDKALKLLEKTQENYQGIEPHTVNMLYQIYLRMKLPGKAIQLLNRLLAIPGNERNPALLLLRAKIEIGSLHQYDKAAEDIRRALDSDPDNPEAKNLKLALSVIRQNMTTLPMGLELNQVTTEMLIRYASTIWEDGRQQESLKLLQNMYARKPDNLAVVVRLIESHIAAGQSQEAKSVIQEALARNPDNRVLQILDEQLGQADPKKRLDLMMARAEKIEDPVARNLKKADISATMGKTEDYLKYIRAAEEINPDSDGVIRRMFQYALRQKDWTLAEKYRDKAMKTNLDGLNGKLFKAELAASRGEYEKAIDILKDALEIRPSMKNASALLGNCYLETRQIEEAQKVFESVAEDAPGYLPALIGMAKVTELQGKWSEHTEWIRRAYRQPGGKNHRYVRDRFLTTAESASVEEIIAKRRQIRRRDPDDVMNLLQLAGLYEQTNQDKQAEQTYKLVAGKISKPVVGYQPLIRFYHRNGRISDAEKIITGLIAAAKESGDTSSLVGLYVLWSRVLTDSQPEQAEKALEKAVEIGGGDTRGLSAMISFLASRRQWSRAADYMEEYLRLRPNDRSAQRQLVGLHIDAGNYSLAENKLENILRERPDDVQARILEAILSVKRDNYDKADKILTDIITQHPDYPPAYVRRAVLYRQRGQLQKALDDLEKAREISPTAQIAMELAATYRAVGRADQALRVYREIYSKNKRFPPVVNALIDLYINQKEWRQAEAMISEAKTNFPDNVNYLLAEQKMWELRESPQQRIEALTKAYEMSPDSRYIFSLYLSALTDAGGDNLSRALELCDSYQEREGFEVFTRMYRGVVLAKQNNTAGADSNFAAAVEISPPGIMGSVVNNIKEVYGLSQAIQRFAQWSSQRNDWASNLFLGRLYQEDQQIDKALEMYRRALELSRDDNQKAQAYLSLAIVYQMQEKYSQAESAYLDVLKLRPNYVRALNNLAYMYADELSNPNKALQYAQKAYIIEPASANVLDTYGWTLALLEKYDQAEKYLARSIRLDNSLAENRYHLGWVYEKTTRLNQAMKLYRQAYELARRDKNQKLLKLVQGAMKRVNKRLGATVGSS